MVPFAGGSLLGTPVAPFCLDATEVTVAAYEQCVVTGRCAEAGGTLAVVDHAALKFPTDERALAMWRRACNRGKDRYPVNCVTWSEARTYCEAVGKRLPAYSEWKLAECPSPTDVYPWGRDLPAPFYANLCGTECSGAVKPDQISHADNWIHSAVVGATRKLPQGVYDLAGNVAEWVEGAGEKKYALGCGAQRLVSADNRAPNVGFRCAADPQRP
ncbi:MAG: SUMF1/EgtB/PvdO family nonheme iron enzyme [Myxococcales bacterium]|nr:SUMF1/EgtB/PvdO family nonheme iron enzyme [Myxococcales bacterium]